MGTLRAICLYVALVVASGALAGAAFGQTLNPRDDGARLLRALQIDLASLSERVTMLRQSAAPGLQLGEILTALDRIRALDLLLDEHHRAVGERLRNENATATVAQRQAANVRRLRDGLDRVYAIAAPLTSRPDQSPVDAAALEQVLSALADALAIEDGDADRTPHGVTLPYRSLGLPQAAPRDAAPVTPAYLQRDAPAPVAADLATSPDTELTPAIRARADTLSHDPIAIFEFVANDIRTDFYYGAMKDAADTLRTMRGNDVDQATLLVALLRASRIPARYVRGIIRLTGAQAIAWSGAGESGSVYV
jgi:hypothetical protein